MGKNLIKSFLIIITILLITLPAILTFSNILTKSFEKFKLYTYLQDFVVPVQVRVVGVFVDPFVNDYVPVDGGMLVNNISYRMSWNCLGWQSLILFLITLFIGFSNSNFTFTTKLETILIGLFGIFWVNVFRITFIVLLGTWSSAIYQVVYHDYLAAIVTVFYLVGFWWFSYKYVLEEKINNI